MAHRQSRGSATDQVIADGVDEQMIEGNRSLFAGRLHLVAAACSTLYAASHMAALNGLSISGWTGVEVPLLPQFLLEIQNFRIVNIAGASARGIPLPVGTLRAIPCCAIERHDRIEVAASDVVLALAAAVIAIGLVAIYGTAARNAVGTPFVPIGVAFAATAGTATILELTRRVAGLALVAIAAVFLLYTFTAHLLQGLLAVQNAYSRQRFFGHVYSDAGSLGPTTTAVSSTSVILFAAFLQASKVGDYFANFASGLMGMINGTSIGSVVATGSLTIPITKRVGDCKQTAGAIEAAASAGGQTISPIMGVGVFMTAEITGIPYQEIAIAPSICFMFDLEAAKLNVRGLRQDELPRLAALARQACLFVPILILIVALFPGHSLIRAGTLVTVAAPVVSSLTPQRMGPRALVRAFELAGVMSIQITVACDCAGIIVGVISLTGLVARFSAVVLDLAATSQLLALFFAMCIAILLGMGMPTTAACAVAASVVAPGLVQLGIPALTAHLLVCNFAVVSAITSPVALASYAAAGILCANPLETSVTSSKIGLAVFVVPFMFLYNGAFLTEGALFDVLRAGATATIGVFLLSAAIQCWFMRQRKQPLVRFGLIFAALCMIEGGWLIDVADVAWLAEPTSCIASCRTTPTRQSWCVAMTEPISMHPFLQLQDISPPH